jgi:hypothetical protein
MRRLGGTAECNHKQSVNTRPIYHKQQLVHILEGTIDQPKQSVSASQIFAQSVGSILPLSEPTTLSVLPPMHCPVLMEVAGVQAAAGG